MAMKDDKREETGKMRTTTEDTEKMTMRERRQERQKRQ